MWEEVVEKQRGHIKRAISTQTLAQTFNSQSFGCESPAQTTNTTCRYAFQRRMQRKLLRCLKASLIKLAHGII